MSFNKKTDNILFIDLPPSTIYENVAVSHKGINYIRSYLFQNEIKNDCYVLDYDYLHEIYYNHMIIASKSLKEKIFSNKNKEELTKTVKTILIPKLKEYNVLAFSLFLYDSYLMFELLFEILEQEIDISKFKIIIGGNYLRFPNVSEKFTKYTKYICTKYGEQYFQKLYDLPDFKMYSYNQYIEPKDIIRYRDHFHISDKIITPITVFFSDSCINHCYFCINAIRNEHLSYRGIDDTIREIIYFKKLKIPHFVLDCENLPSNYKVVNKFTSKLQLINRDNSITWTANFSPFNEHNLSYKNLDMKQLFKSGCVLLIMGIESFSETVRLKLGKPTYTNKELFEFFDFALDIGFKLEINLFTGFFTETREDYDEAYIELKKCLEKYSSRIWKTTVSIYDILHEEETGYWYNGEKIEYDKKGYWQYNDNTFEERKYRWNKFYDLIDTFDIPTRQNFKINKKEVTIL